jgi:ABC-type phosphate transport system substrate-binding protein
MNRSHTQALLAIVLGVFSTLAASEEVVVIVNPANTTSAMTVDQVTQIYLGKTTSLPTGGNASAVDLAEGSTVRDDFYLKVAARSGAQVKAVWARLMFSGKNTPPRVLVTSAEVKKYVAANANGIGYIEKSAADASVRIVLSIP